MKKVQPTTIRDKMNFKVTILLLLLPAVVAAQKLPEENYIRGYAFYQQEAYDSAIVCLGRSLKINEKNTDALYYRGLSYLKSGDAAKALNDFNDVDKADPGRGAIWSARISARENNIDETLRYLDLHLKSNHRLPESAILLDKDMSVFENNPKWIHFWKESNYYTGFDQSMAEADYMVKSGDYIEAADVLSEALKGNYRKAPLYAKRAEVYLKTGNDHQALEDLNAALTTDKRNADLYARRGDLNLKLGKYRDALEDFTSALKYDPDNFSLYPKRAQANSKSSLYDEAVSDMEFYLKYFGNDHENWYRFGTINQENHKLFKALECYNKALALDQSKPEYFLARGETYMETRTYKYARNDFSMALDLDPRNATAYFDLGLAAIQLGNKDEACFGFNKAFEYGLFEARDYVEKYCK